MKKVKPNMMKEMQANIIELMKTEGTTGLRVGLKSDYPTTLQPRKTIEAEMSLILTLLCGKTSGSATSGELSSNGMILVIKSRKAQKELKFIIGNLERKNLLG